MIRPIPQLAEARCAPSYAVADLGLPRLRLDPPRLRLWLNGQEIHFGDTAPTDGQRYLRVGETVPSVSRPLVSAVDQRRREFSGCAY